MVPTGACTTFHGNVRSPKMGASIDMATPFIILMLLGFSMKQTIQLGVPPIFRRSHIMCIHIYVDRYKFLYRSLTSGNFVS